MTHPELKEKALNRKNVKAEYKEFELLRELLDSRQKAGVSQAEIAERMVTKAPAITRLESSLSSGKHSPSIAIIKR